LDKKTDFKIPENERTPLQNLADGKMLLTITNLEDEFKNYSEQFPKAEPQVCSIREDGTPILALVENNKIVCPVGFRIFYSDAGEQMVEYVRI
jgi:hypothetical protein